MLAAEGKEFELVSANCIFTNHIILRCNEEALESLEDNRVVYLNSRVSVLHLERN